MVDEINLEWPNTQLCQEWLFLPRLKFDEVETEYYEGDTQMPIYSRAESGYPVGSCC